MMLAGRFSLGRIDESWDIGMLGWPVVWTLLIVMGVNSFFPGQAGYTGGLCRSDIWKAIVATWCFHVVIAISFLWSHYPSYGKEIALETILVSFLATVTVTTYISTPDKTRWLNTLVTILALVGVVYAIGGIASGLDEWGRMSAFTGGPGVFGRTVGMGLVCAAYLGGRLDGWKSGAWFFVVMFLTVALVASGSRTAWIATSVALVFVAWSYRSCILTSPNQIRFLAVVAVTYGVLMAWAVYPEVFAVRVVEATMETQYTSGRVEMWGDALRIIGQYPLFGTGAGSFQVFSQPALSLYDIAWTPVNLYPHNMFLDIAVTVGVWAAVLTGALMAWALWKARDNLQSPIMVVIGSLFILQFLAQMASGTFYDGRWMWLFFILFVIRAEREATCTTDS